MTASLTLAVGGGLVKRGEDFEAVNEEDARLYEEKGLARKTKKAEPSRTQDVQAEEPPQPKRGRPPKTRRTKAEGNSEQDVEE